MARIYIARTTGIGAFERHVVLKLILPERAEDDIAVKMFLDEARLAAMLNHQNIAQVFEVGEDSGVHYLAMEYVHGQDLRAFLARAGSGGIRVPLELGMTIVAGAAAGLNHAHERRSSDGSPLGIVHRDVSPSNIMVGYDGAVKMLDFGIAKAAQRSVETVSGIIKGKFAYMSPEQCRGRDVDRRSDVFSLGIILYESTTQHRCFRADSDFDTMHRIVTGDVVRPSRLVPNYPPALEAIVMRALSVDVNQRFQSAGLLLEALEGYSLQNRTPLSTMGLGRFMRELFGEVPEPWLQHGASFPGYDAPREGTISNTEGGGAAQSRLPPSPSQLPPLGPPGPPATLKMAGVQPETGSRRTGPSAAVIAAGQTLVDDVVDAHGEPDWESARSYPVASSSAVASPQTMPPDVALGAPRHTPSNPLARAQRDSRTPSAGGRSYPPAGGPSTLPGLAAAPHGSNPSLPSPQGSLPGGGPVGPGGYPQVSKATAEAMAMAPTQLGPMQAPGSPFASNPGSSVSHSHVTPYPQPAGVEGYESLKPTRRPLYIGFGLALVGAIIALAIGSGGDGPDEATPDPTPPETAGVQPMTTTDNTTATLPPVTDPPPVVTPPDKPDVVEPTPTPPDMGRGSGGTVATVPPPSGDIATPDKPDPDKADQDEPDKPPVEDTPPPKPTTIAVVIKSDPAGADVLKDGKRVGKTPYETTLPIGEKPTTYTVRADRYVDETVTVKPSKDFTATLKLEKKRVARPDKPDKPDKPKAPCQKKGAPQNPFLAEKDKLPPCD
jgi:serine/threonine-protein kinase